MEHKALRVIRDEHTALAAVLRTLPMLLARHHQDRTLPDFQALRAMLFYIDEFPERLHHAKESRLLFPRLRLRSERARDLLDRLDREHEQGERAMLDLEHALLGFEMMGESRRERFEQAVERYVAFYLAHMRVEEDEILPLAAKVLTDEDWAVLDPAFAANLDPLTGHPAQGEYEALFSRIVRLVPAPLGLG